MMLTATRIRELMEALNSELAREPVRGELFLAGDPGMCLPTSYDARLRLLPNARDCPPIGSTMP